MNIELLAPAGSYESLIAAVNAGADAVYIGGNKFSARAYANNLDSSQLKEAIDYVHLHKCKLYLAVNTLLKEKEVNEELFDYICEYYEHGVDAVIVQDFGVLSFLRTHFKDLPLHASTQMTITDAYGAKFLEKQGVQRVVTSRELSLEEIKRIKTETNLEIESFVHGALCYSYSGQCLYSSLIGGRSGNRGRCAQPCRLPYDVVKEGRKINARSENYILSPKDICTVDMLPELAAAGITSFKIEGRMKKPEYTAGVVSIYRKYLDLYLELGKANYKVAEEDRKILLDLYNRGGFSKGYYVQKNGKNMMSLTRPNHWGIKVAKVVGMNQNKISLQATEYLNQGDVLELKSNSERGKQDYVCSEEVRKGEKIEIALKSPKTYENGEFVFRTRNEELLQALKTTYLNGKKQEKIKGKLTFLQDNPVILEINLGEIQVRVEGEVPIKAQNQPLTVEKVDKQMRKTGNTPFQFDELEIQLEAGLFMAMQSLNEIRRQATDELERIIVESYRRASVSMKEGIREIPLEIQKNSEDFQINIYVEKLSYIKEVLETKEIHSFYIDCSAISFPYGDNQLKEVLTRCRANKKKCYFVFPHIFRGNVIAQYKEHWSEFLALDFAGILVKNVETYQFLQELSYDGELVLDHNMYTFNKIGRKFWKEKHISHDTIPVELNYGELRQRECQNSELIVYGYLPMMISAQCVKNTTMNCDGKAEELYLKDRLGKLFGVKNACAFCSNTIYNSEPLVLLDQYKEITTLQVKKLRLHFTMEDRKQVRKITQSYIDHFIHKKRVIYENKNFTRGHFKRGIE